MFNNDVEPKSYMYTYTYTAEEFALSQLESRAFFGRDTDSKLIESSIKIDPSRSPFIKERIAILFKERTLNDLSERVRELPHLNKTFKVVVIKNAGDKKIEYPERRRIEREIGLVVPGIAHLTDPEMVFGIIKISGEWVFGYYEENKGVWFKHQKKPHNYSTALSTRVARAIVNIAAPNPSGIKAIDPCCGIGTVLIEALSMGIDIIGSDNNPLVMKGVRENIAYFGLNGQVQLRDIRDVNGHFDVTIIDMPYNLCSVLPDDDKLDMLHAARRFTEKLVLVTIEPIDLIIRAAGFQIVDRCEVRKGKFVRHVFVCK